jgi:hypothetical protein
LMVTSRTYRLSSAAPPGLEEKDPMNRLFARQARLRLDAEFVRDQALAISGLLHHQVGGPSVRPYQPEGYFAPLNFPRREYVQSTGTDLYRRSVYTHWQRTFTHPSLVAFDAPSREECTAVRVNSNTPIQALVLLNDPIYVEAARVFAERIVRQGGSRFGSRLEWAYRQALQREPRPEERRLLEGFYRKELERFQHDLEAARRLISVGDAPLRPHGRLTVQAAWTSVARALLNVHETITRN